MILLYFCPHGLPFLYLCLLQICEHFPPHAFTALFPPLGSPLSPSGRQPAAVTSSPFPYSSLPDTFVETASKPFPPNPCFPGLSLRLMSFLIAGPGGLSPYNKPSFPLTPLCLGAPDGYISALLRPRLPVFLSCLTRVFPFLHEACFFGKALRKGSTLWPSIFFYFRPFFLPAYAQAPSHFFL